MISSDIVVLRPTAPGVAPGTALPAGPAGPAGPIGLQGPIGPKGDIGGTGPQGIPGPQGATAAIQGPPGPTGPQGLPGPLGGVGPVGPKGDTGPAGAAGPQGQIGATGTSGAVGPVGPAGATGPQGGTGVQGATGAVGPKGDTGATGPIGPAGPAGQSINLKGTVATSSALPSSGNSPGDAYTVTSYSPAHLFVWNGSAFVDQGPFQGATGPAGAAGAIGATGPAGPAGQAGPIGPQGPTGAIGSTGATGPKGDTGAAGPTGAIGPTGATSPKGDIGATGPAGAAGATGPAGPQGSTGPQGPIGPQGSPTKINGKLADNTGSVTLGASDILIPSSVMASHHAPGTHMGGLPNGNFEDGLKGWATNSSGTGSVVLDNAVSRTGANEVGLTNNASGDTSGLYGALFPAGEGIPQYVGVVAALSFGSAAGFIFQVFFYDRNKSVITAINNPPGIGFPSSGFTEIGTTLTPPANTRYMSVNVINNTVVGVIRIDEVKHSRSLFVSTKSTLPAVRHRNDKSSDIIDLRDYLGLGSADDTALLSRAVADAANETLHIRAPITINPGTATTIVVPANVELAFGPRGKIVLGARATLQVAGTVTAGIWRIFDVSGGGSVVATYDCRTPVVRPEWWGAVPTFIFTPGSDCAPALQAAINFAAAYSGTVRLYQLVYNCLSGIVIANRCTLEGLTPAIGATGGQSILDFSGSPAATIGLTVGAVYKPVVKNLAIARTLQSRGQGGLGLNINSTNYPFFSGISVYGFDVNLYLGYTPNTPGANPVLAPYFVNCEFGPHATMCANIYAQTTAHFAHCIFSNKQNADQMILLGGGATCDTTLWTHCILGDTELCPYNIKIIGGIYHTFYCCDIETASIAGIVIAYPQEPDEAVNIVTVDDCWINDCGICILNTGALCSFKVINCPRLASTAAACINIDDYQGTLRKKNIIIAGNFCYNQNANGTCIAMYHVVAGAIQDNSCHVVNPSGGTNTNPAIVVGGISNIVTGNRTQVASGTTPIVDVGTSNLVADNVNYSPN